MSSYVLGRWRQTPAEVTELVDRAADAVERIVDGRDTLADVYDRAMRARWRPLTVALLLTVGGGTAVAAASSPPAFGPADGVQATRAADGDVEIRLTGPAAAALDGHDLSVDCGVHRESVGLLFTGRGAVDGDSNTYGASGTVSAAGVLRIEIGTSRPLDGCVVQDGRTIVARAALDTAGAVWADEAPRALALRDLLSRARTASSYRPVAVIVGGAVVALDGPAATAPAGQLGYWTDGAAHAVATTTSAAGRVLTLEDLGAGMLRTDVLDQGDVLDSVFAAALGGDAVTGGLVGSAQGRTPQTASPYRGPPLERRRRHPRALRRPPPSRALHRALRGGRAQARRPPSPGRLRHPAAARPIRRRIARAGRPHRRSAPAQARRPSEREPAWHRRRLPAV